MFHCQALVEAMVWADLEHRNILEYIGLDDAIFPNHPPCIVTLWMQNGTVMEHIRDNMPPDASIDSLVRSPNSISPIYY